MEKIEGRKDGVFKHYVELYSIKHIVKERKDLSDEYVLVSIFLSIILKNGVREWICNRLKIDDGRLSKLAEYVYMYFADSMLDDVKNSIKKCEELGEIYREMIDILNFKSDIDVVDLIEKGRWI